MKPILLIAVLLLCGCESTWPTGTVIDRWQDGIDMGWRVKVMKSDGALKTVRVSRELSEKCELGGKFPPFEINTETE